MATASKIKSKIISQGQSQRQLTSQLANVSENLIKAEESANLNEFRAKEEERVFATAFSALEAGSTFLEGIKQSKELESDIDFLTDALNEKGKKVSMSRGDKSSLMDVLTGSASVSDYLYGQKKYSLDGKNIGTKYDVSAMGKTARALTQENLLESFLSDDLSLPQEQSFVGISKDSNMMLSQAMSGPKISFEDKFTPGGTLIKSKQSKSELEKIKSIDKKTINNNFVKDNNTIPKKIVDKIDDIPKAWLEPADTDEEGNKLYRKEGDSDFIGALEFSGPIEDKKSLYSFFESATKKDSLRERLSISGQQIKEGKKEDRGFRIDPKARAFKLPKEREMSPNTFKDSLNYISGSIAFLNRAYTSSSGQGSKDIIQNIKEQINNLKIGIDLIPNTKEYSDIKNKYNKLLESISLNEAYVGGIPSAIKIARSN